MSQETNCYDRQNEVCFFWRLNFYKQNNNKKQQNNNNNNNKTEKLMQFPKMS